MKQFNYKRAWIEMAVPAFEALTSEVVTLIAETVAVSADLSQKEDLDMPWPDGLRAEFEKIDSLELAKAARAVYQIGHWKPFFREVTLFDLPEGSSIGSAYRDATRLVVTGGYWKFSNYADQVLTERLGFPRLRGSGGKRGTSHVVIEGALRACLSTEDLWTWEEIGWAVGSPRLSDILGLGSPGTGVKAEENFKAYVVVLRKACEDAGFKEATDTSRFMEDE